MASGRPLAREPPFNGSADLSYCTTAIEGAGISDPPSMDGPLNRSIAAAQPRQPDRGL